MKINRVKMKKTLLFFGLLLLSLSQVQAQKTVGVLTYTDSLIQPGYNLFFPHNQSTVWLIDNCGRVVNSWDTGTDMRPGNSAELADNGDLFVLYRPANFINDPIYAGGGGMTVARVTWDNTPVWEYSLNDSMARLHHDFAPMPNGNVLVIAWERIELAEMVAAGRDTSLFVAGEVWPDMVLELQPNGSGGADVVWEWHSWDHLIQDHDASKANFGVVGDHPELIDLNYDDFSGVEADWHHMNAMDYNAELDQIILSVPSFNEVWIIDHSTTTAEAASHSGGTSNKGGDLIYRWGNPLAYDNGDSTDIMLNFQHDIHWIDDHLESSAADYGKLAVFNNQAGADFSATNIFAPVWDDVSKSYGMSGGTYLPATFDWTFTTTPPQDMHSTGLSGLQRLPNGNTLIQIGRAGRAIEITPSEQIVWEYIQPLVQGNPTAQGDSLAGANLAFRMNRYMPDFSGFSGRTLVSGNYLELNPDTAFCNLPLVAASDRTERQISYYPNPTTGVLYLSRETAKPAQVEVYDLAGHRVHQQQITGFNPKVDLTNLQRGLYLLRLDGVATGKVLLSE